MTQHNLSQSPPSPNRCVSAGGEGRRTFRPSTVRRMHRPPLSYCTRYRQPSINLSCYPAIMLPYASISATVTVAPGTFRKRKRYDGTRTMLRQETHYFGTPARAKISCRPVFHQGEAKRRPPPPPTLPPPPPPPPPCQWLHRQVGLLRWGASIYDRSRRAAGGGILRTPMHD